MKKNNNKKTKKPKKSKLARSLVVGADVNQADANGWTSLFRSSYEGHVEAVRCLVKELGANVNQADAKGCTPLHASSQEPLAFSARRARVLVPATTSSRCCPRPVAPPV